MVPSLAAVRTATVKSVLTKGGKFIGTHNGAFHCDEALAVSLLKTLPLYEHHEIIRTRDPKILEQCDIVVDVGGEYDPSRNRFDHHQSTFDLTLESKKTKLSSAGLIYKHFGKEIIHQICSSRSLSQEIVDIIYEKMYSGFMEHIDAIDNGIEISDGEIRYKVTTSLSSRVSFLNPQWNEDNSEDIFNLKFKEAMLLTSSEFIQHLIRLTDYWLPARSIVEDAINKRYDVDPSGAIIVLERFCPWKSHLFDIEDELEISGNLKYVLYEDSSSMWRIQCVGIKDSEFANRLSLPKEWRGLRDEELVRISSIAGCRFVHAAGFIGGNTSKEGVLKMAISALALDPSSTAFKRKLSNVESD